MNVVGVANHSPDFVWSYLRKKANVDVADVLLVGSATKLPKKTNKTHVIFLGVPVLARQIESVNSEAYSGKVGFVCDSPLSLHRLSGIREFDYSESPDPHIDGFVLRGPDPSVLKLGDSAVSYERNDYTDVILTKVQSFVGILTSFMTFVYTMPSATHQKPVKTLACEWLCSTDSTKALRVKLAALTRECPMSAKQQARFMELLTSDAAVKYKLALLKLQNRAAVHDPKHFGAVVSEHGVSAYELRYILSVARPGTCKQ